MATDQEKAALVGVAAVGTGAFLLRGQKAGTTPPPPPPPPGEDSTLALLRLILAEEKLTRLDLATILDQIKLLNGFYLNTLTIQVAGDVCAAVNTPYPMPDMAVPDGMSLVILAWPTNAPGSLIYVSHSASGATNLNQAWPLIPGATISYRVRNAKELYVATNAAASRWSITAERR